ncbi:MAG TPA: phosphate/phosphite/phosphonate ABC transporter substrate-binding protein, partial [Planctomycetota bacterium]|nr:phosphate/phosphite/phosphonate ABC transporter substrate-binding protein [Planctomycetota bacterium]
GQGSTTTAPPPGPEAKAGKPSKPATGVGGRLVFGLYPSDSPTEMYRQFLPLCEYLTEATGYPVELDVSPTYAAGIEKIRKGEVDLFRSGPGAFGHLLLEEKSRAPILVAVEQEGEKKETTLRGAIVTRQDAPFRSIQDLAGKTFAFGDRRSTMATQVPRRMLADAGVKLAAFDHLKSHDDVALAVLNGEFDAGACKAPTAEKYKEKGLRILVLTEPSPSKPIYARYGLEERKIEAVRKALLALDVARPEHRAILAGIEAKLTGYSAAKDPAEYEQFARFLGPETEEPAPPPSPGQ